MKEYILKNGLKLVYKNTDSMLSSISIALDAGAVRDTDGKLGIAHVTEHMIYKGTDKRTEAEINKKFSEIFGFQNAMTNYPYVIYYGTLLSEDLEEGIELYADLLINTTLGNSGFKEEMDVIKEELKEWDEEVEQFCEDKLFLNSYKHRRIKYPIIGTEESLENISIQDVKEFYNKYYSPENTTMVIISNKSFEDIIDIVNKYFIAWENACLKLPLKESEKAEGKIYKNKKEGINTAKVLITYDISDLTHNEIKIFKVLNQYIGEGVNSLLFDSLRTKKGLVYDVLTMVSNESSIGLYKITFSTSEEKVQEAINCIDNIFENLQNSLKELSKNQISGFVKSLKLKRLFNEEQSIRLSNSAAMYDVMFGDYKLYLDEIQDLEKISKEDLLNISNKVFHNKSIEIITR
ncbi:MAG: insulinase family protein [Clostridium sp.]|nr:insulinase family protein [Clostridium sp.]